MDPFIGIWVEKIQLEPEIEVAIPRKAGVENVTTGNLVPLSGEVGGSKNLLGHYC